VELVKDYKRANKSYGNSITISYDVTDAETAKIFLLSLCETIGARIRMDGAFISMVSVSIVDFNFHRQSHQMQLTGFDQLWNHEPIRQIGVSTGHITDSDNRQYDLFDTEKNEKLSKLNAAIDSIRTRYGEDSIQRARFLNTEQSHMAGGLSKEKRTF